MISETVRSLALRAHQKGIEVIFGVALDVPRQCIGDPGRIRQVLLNLLGNAVKFTDKGEIEVTARIVAHEGKQLQVAIAVRDTGVGIAPEKRDEVFGAFAQADTSTTRKYGGTGLGLAISKRLVEMMNGGIRVESRPGEGSLFEFSVSLEAVAESEAPSRRANELLRRSVLVVAGNMALAQSIASMVETWGGRSSIANSKADALALLKFGHQRNTPFDFMVVDAGLEKDEGFSLVAHFRDQTPYVERIVMMLNAHSQRNDAIRCRKLGISSRLAKPFSTADLHDALALAVLGDRDDDDILAEFDPQMTLTEMVQDGEVQAGLEVLLVEDNPVNQTVGLKMLQKAGHRVSIAGNGQEALDLLEQHRFNLILMDADARNGRARSGPGDQGEKRAAVGRPVRGEFDPDHRHDRPRDAGRSRALPGCGHGRLCRQADPTRRAVCGDRAGLRPERFLRPRWDRLLAARIRERRAHHGPRGNARLARRRRGRALATGESVHRRPAAQPQGAQ